MRVNRLKIQSRGSDDIGLCFKDDNYHHEEDNAYSHVASYFTVPYLRQTFRWFIGNRGFKTIGYHANW